MMNSCFFPPQTLPCEEYGRKLDEADSLEALKAQLLPGEELLGLYDYGSHQIAPRLLPDEFAKQEALMISGVVKNLGYFAVTEKIFKRFCVPKRFKVISGFC